MLKCIELSNMRDRKNYKNNKLSIVDMKSNDSSYTLGMAKVVKKMVKMVKNLVKKRDPKFANIVSFC